MKKLLFMVAAVLVMVSCGSKEDKLTPEQRAEKFAHEFAAGMIAMDKEAVEDLITDIKAYYDKLDEESKSDFRLTFLDELEDSMEECTAEQGENIDAFIISNIGLFQSLEILN